MSKETKGRKGPDDPGDVKKARGYRLRKKVRDILIAQEPISHTETIENALLEKFGIDK